MLMTLTVLIAVLDFLPLYLRQVYGVAPVEDRKNRRPFAMKIGSGKKAECPASRRWQAAGVLPAVRAMFGRIGRFR